MNDTSIIPALDHEAAIVGLVTGANSSLPPTWLDVVHEIQRWT
jgi:hypothetical protein